MTRITKTKVGFSMRAETKRFELNQYSKSIDRFLKDLIITIKYNLNTLYICNSVNI